MHRGTTDGQAAPAGPAVHPSDEESDDRPVAAPLRATYRDIAGTVPATLAPIPLPAVPSVQPWAWFAAATTVACAVVAAPAAPLVAGAATAIVLAAAWSLRRPARPPADHTAVLEVDPELLALRARSLGEELVHLAAAQDLQAGVFEVSTELVGCVDEADAHVRFAAAMRRYWAAERSDLLIWERGTWRGLGESSADAPPVLSRPVQLPEDTGGDLILDLSPGVSGQAALVMRGARPQPSLDGCDAAARRAVAEVLRGQLTLSLRRVALYHELQDMARIDPLTGAQRRWYGDLRLREMVGSGRPLAVAVVDIDRFKAVNDRLGHAAGDVVLAGVGRALAGHLRTGDLVVRTGGEEFAVLLPETDLAGARLVAERLRAAVAALTTLPTPVTVSVGLAVRGDGDSPETLLARADAACYEAKRSGRDRVVGP